MLRREMRIFNECGKGFQFWLFHFQVTSISSSIKWGKGHHLSYDEERQYSKQRAFAPQMVAIICASFFHSLCHCHCSDYIFSDVSFQTGLCALYLPSPILPSISRMLAETSCSPACRQLGVEISMGRDGPVLLDPSVSGVFKCAQRCWEVLALSPGQECVPGRGA